jgi:hypothetical protein
VLFTAVHLRDGVDWPIVRIARVTGRQDEGSCGRKNVGNRRGRATCRRPGPQRTDPPGDRAAGGRRDGARETAARTLTATDSEPRRSGAHHTALPIFRSPPFLPRDHLSELDQLDLWLG